MKEQIRKAFFKAADFIEANPNKYKFMELTDPQREEKLKHLFAENLNIKLIFRN